MSLLLYTHKMGLHGACIVALVVALMAPPQYVAANATFSAFQPALNTCAAPTTRNDAVCQGGTQPIQGGLLASAFACGAGATLQISWWSAAQGGAKLADGAVFNPIAAGLVSTNTPAAFTYWAQYTCTDAAGNVCTSPRSPAVFTVKSTQLSCLGQINTVLTPFCTATITTRSILTGDVVGFEDMRIQLLDAQNRILEEGIGSLVVDGMSVSGTRYEVINRTYTYKVIEPCFNSFCTGSMLFSDRIAPILTAPRDTALFCALYQNFQNPDPVRFGEPLVNDCSRTSYTYTDRLWETDCRSPYTAFPTDLATNVPFPNHFDDIIKIIERTFFVRDIYNNQSTCRQLIYVRKAKLSAVVCPSNLEFECQNVSGALSLAQTGSPMLDVDGLASTAHDRVALNEGSCTLVASFRDDTFRLCRNSYKIFRTWTVRDLFCTPDNPNTPADESIRLCTQIIHISDKTPPSVSASFTQYYVENSGLVGRDTVKRFDGVWRQDGQSVMPTWQEVWPLGQTNTCGAQALFALRATDQSCTQSMVNFQVNDSRVQLVRGYPTFNAATGETVALYTVVLDENTDVDILFTVGDECGFAKAQQGFRLRVRDNIMPQPACIATVRTTLNNLGSATLTATALNAGSNDNCGIAGFKVRRLSQNGQALTGFDDVVTFSCADVHQSWPVELQVTDFSGNTNTCTVWVTVEDKTKPTCLAPPRREVLCQTIPLSDLSAYGTPIFWDNCQIVDTVYSELRQINNCGVGTILRKWVVRDASGGIDSCTQTIVSRGYTDFTVDFPDDRTVSCAADVPSIAVFKQQLLNNPPTVDGHIINNGCGSIGIDIQDDTLSGLGFCYKIVRKISVIDFCKYQFNGGADAGMAKPVCGDVHSTSNWAQTNTPAWPNVARPACATTRDRRFREADDLASEQAAFADGIVCFTQIITVLDTTAPVWTASLADTLIENFTENCQITAAWQASAADVCDNTTAASTNVRFFWQLRDSATQTVVNSGQTAQFSAVLDNNKTYFLEWMVSDLCQNRTTRTQKIRAQDRKRPAIFCRNTALNLVAVTPGAGRATVQATALLAANLSDNCTPTSALNARLALDLDTSATRQYPNFQVREWTFDCRHVGQNVALRVWTMDAAGNADYCLAQVSIQDNAQACVVPTTTISGQITNENNVSISGATVAVWANNAVLAQTTASSGAFSINNLPRGGTYTVIPERNDNPLNGVTTFDLALMSKHILGIQKLASPYKILAADVNRDNDISAIDMLQTRRVILRIVPAFPNSQSWRFLPKNTVFTDVEDPFATDFSEFIRVENTPEAVQTHFVGFKVGDVNGSATPVSNVQTVVLRGDTPPQYLRVGAHFLTKGETVAVPIWVEDTAVAALQGTLKWSEALEVVEVTAGDMTGFGRDNMGFFDHSLTFSWVKNGASGGKKLLILHLKALQDVDIADHLYLSSALTAALAFDSRGAEAPLSMRVEKAVRPVSELVLHQNSPNPFQDNTEIAFAVPTAGTVLLTVFDASGHIYHQEQHYFEAGSHRLELNAAQLNLPKGVLLYRLTAGNLTQTKKMVRL